jgi:hypothetical protein
MGFLNFSNALLVFRKGASNFFYFTKIFYRLHIDANIDIANATSSLSLTTGKNISALFNLIYRLYCFCDVFIYMIYESIHIIHFYVRTIERVSVFGKY